MARVKYYIKETHRGLWYEDGAFIKELGPGRHEAVAPGIFNDLRPLVGLKSRPRVEVEIVDLRSRDLTIKGQEILTSDKVAIRVSILVQFAVVDARAAVHAVADYTDRLYSDVQLAARRSLASMTLEDILTNRTRLSEDIVRDVRESAGMYGVAIARADVKDLVFPGNLQEVMNRVLAAERMSEVQLVEARTRAEAQRIESMTQAEGRKLESQADAERTVAAARSAAEASRLALAAELEALEARSKAASLYRDHPALLRLEELRSMRELAVNANARLYVDLKPRPDRRETRGG